MPTFVIGKYFIWMEISCEFWRQTKLSTCHMRMIIILFGDKKKCTGVWIRTDTHTSLLWYCTHIKWLSNLYSPWQSLFFLSQHLNSSDYVRQCAALPFIKYLTYYIKRINTTNLKKTLNLKTFFAKKNIHIIYPVIYVK